MPESRSGRRTKKSSYLLGLLLLIFAFNNVDGVALGIVLQDIKVDLSLSDTQLGFLTGLAFALFYAVMGIPLARWADRGNRVTVITVTTGLWSVAVALCGATTSFLQLLLVRIGVAVGEAGCHPTTHSLIADYFSREERPRAVSRYMLGLPLALTMGYFAAGWLAQLFGWRMTFVLLGLPGVVLAALALLTLHEPRLARAPPEPSAPAPSQPSLKVVAATLWASPTFRHLLFCFSVWYFFGYGLLQWEPTFFARSHGLKSGEIGTWFAVIFGVGSGLGTYLGGELSSRYAAGNERLQLNIAAAGFVVFGIVTVGAFLATDYRVAFVALGLASLGGNMAQAPMLATIQTLVPPPMRAMSLAIIYFFANLIGMGLGPLAAGFLSDSLHPWFGDESLRCALIVLCPGYFWAAWHLRSASRKVHGEVAKAQWRPGTGDAKPIEGEKVADALH